MTTIDRYLDNLPDAPTNRLDFDSLFWQSRHNNAENQPRKQYSRQKGFVFVYAINKDGVDKLKQAASTDPDPDMTVSKLVVDICLAFNGPCKLPDGYSQSMIRASVNVSSHVADLIVDGAQVLNVKPGRFVSEAVHHFLTTNKGLIP